MKSHAAASRAGPGYFRLARCWAHARSKFYDAEHDFPEAGPILDQIAELYQLEKHGTLEPDASLADVRREQSASVTKKIHDLLLVIEAGPHPEGMSIRVAARYALRNWKELTCFLTVPALPLDNTFTERAIRQPVVGRKNHYGSRSQRGADASMVLYSLIETAKLCGVDPGEYLRDVVINAREQRNFGVTLPFEHSMLSAPPELLPWEGPAPGGPQQSLPL